MEARILEPGLKCNLGPLFLALWDKVITDLGSKPFDELVDILVDQLHLRFPTGLAHR